MPYDEQNKSTDTIFLQHIVTYITIECILNSN